jgi:hypothetical protein
MADQSYRAGVYRKQGGDEMVVTSSGTLTIEGTVASTGTFSFGPVASGSTTANLPAGGVSEVVSGATATGTNSFTMDAPVAGQFKWITATSVATSSDSVTIVGPTTTVTFGPTALPKLRFVAAGSVSLVGASSVKWHFVPISTAIAYATTAA